MMNPEGMTKDEFLAWLEYWQRAYPHDMFPPIDMTRELSDKRDRTCDEAVGMASRNAAAMARHVLARVIEEARKLP